MQIIFFIISFLLLCGCGRPNINHPKDIISTDAKAVIYSRSLERVFEALPQELSIYSNVLYAFAKKDEPIALVLRSVDPVQAYLAIPAKEGFQEELQREIKSQLLLDSEYWSGYVFVALKGSIPSSFGNKNFLPKKNATVLYLKADVLSLVSGNSEVLDTYKEKPLYAFRNILTRSQNKILSRFITHNFLDFARQLEEIEIDCSQDGIEANFKLVSDSKQAVDYNSMKEFKVPRIEDEEGDIAFAFSTDFKKMDFPMIGLETAFKSYLAQINKIEAIFPMDTVFNNLKASGQVRASGAFKITDSQLRGSAIFKAEEQKELNASVIKFADKMSPDIFTELTETEKVKTTKIWTSLILPNKSIETNLNLNIKPEEITITDQGKFAGALNQSEEKALFKLILNAEHFTQFDTNNKKVIITVSVEDNLLRISMSLRK